MSHLTKEHQEVLDRFERWTRKLFGRTTEGDARHFTTNVHTDAQGHLVINRGRMVLVPPETPLQGWMIASLEDQNTIIKDHTLAGALLQALTFALRQDFIEHY